MSYRKLFYSSSLIKMKKGRNGHCHPAMLIWTEKKRQIVEPTIAKIAKQGFENVTTAKIAKEAGWVKGPSIDIFSPKMS